MRAIGLPSRRRVGRHRARTAWSVYRELQRRIPRRLRWSCVAATVVEYGSGAGIMVATFALVAAGLSRDDSAIAVWTVVLAGFLLAAQTGGQLSRRFQLLLQERSAAAVDDEILGVLSSQSSLSVVRDPELRDLLAILKRGRTALAMLPVVVTLMLSLAVRLLLTSAIVVSVSPVLAIVVCTGLAYVYVTFRGRRMTAAMRQAMAAPTRGAERIVDVLVDPKATVEVRSFELLPAAFETVAELTAQTRRELHRSHAKVAVLHGGAAGLFAVVLAAGLAFSQKAGLSAPHLILVALLGRQLSRQVMALVSALSPMAEGITQLRHLAKFRSYTRSRSSAPPAPFPAPPWDLSVQNVSFRYGEGPDVVRDVSLSVGTGRMVALVGPNGSGKSTLLMGILGLLPARAGRFLLQGTDVNLVDERLRSGIGAAFQAPYPFELSVADLVALGRDASGEQVRAALARSGALAFVNSLPAAEQASLGGSLGGPSVSAGQLQRIANARCFLPDRWLLVLDEPGAALDWDAERDLVRTLRDVTRDGPSAVLIVTHRLSLAREADEIIVLSDGVIAERGSHDELMESAGLYRGMFETQARTYGVASPEPQVTTHGTVPARPDVLREVSYAART